VSKNENQTSIAMKKTLLLSLCILGGFSAFAQLGTGMNQWKISSVGHQRGMLMDEYKSMSIDWMRGHTKNEEVIFMDEGEYEIMNEACVMGQQLGFNLGLSSTNLKNEEVSTSQEIRFSVNAVVGREAMVQYNEDVDNQGEVDIKSTVFCLVDNEVNISGAYLLKKRLWRLDLGAGIGGSVGTNFNPQMLKIRSYNSNSTNPEATSSEGTTETETYAAKNSVFGRIYIPLTIGIWMGDKMEFFVEHRIGTGAEKVIDGATNQMGPSLAMLFGLRWHLDSFVATK
jgi:hypothetical protein